MSENLVYPNFCQSFQENGISSSNVYQIQIKPTNVLRDIPISKKLKEFMDTFVSGTHKQMLRDFIINANKIKLEGKYYS